MEQVRRSYVPEDEAFFYREESLGKLCQAQKDLLYLIERGYPMKNASVFTGNHYLLSERQRLALVRATSSRQAAALRGNREVIGPVPGKEVHIDGFNIIITLEIAQRPGRRRPESKKRGQASLPLFVRHISWLFLFISVIE